MFTELKILYESFSDEVSKEIFQNRLLYGLTHDTKYLIDIIFPHFASSQVTWENKDNLINLLKSKPVIIFCAGGQGLALYPILRNLDIDICCFSDNNIDKQGNIYYQLPVVSLAHASQQNPDAHIIIASYEFQDSIMKQFREKRILEKHTVFYFDKAHHTQYFDSSIFPFPNDAEVFVDGGCFSGANSVDFLSWAKNANSKKIIAFEPDSTNYEICKKTLDATSVPYELIGKGLWENDTTLYFTNNGTSGSQIVATGNTKVDVAAIDSLPLANEITFIKMDIEGAELSALKGAKKTIQNNKPRLAICVYHKDEDITEIPAYLKHLVPEYKFYLRHYSLCAYETVLYAYCD